MQRNAFHVLVLIAMTLVLTRELHAERFFVSPAGDDANPGTFDRPFRTLERARDAVRTINQTMTQDIVVHLRGGEYRLSETVNFTPADSGRDGHKVVYSAAPGESVTITGGVRVTNWRVHDAAQNVYRARVPAGRFRQIYVDEAPAIRARTPNRESPTTRGPYWPSTVRETPKARIALAYWQACAPVPAEKRGAVEMVMVCHWYHQRIRIGTVVEDREAGEVEITPVRAEGKFNKPLAFYQNNRGIKNPFHFENALAFLDAPLEWYHDPDERVLYLKLPDGVSPDEARVEVPRVETLIDIAGTPDNPVHDIEFRGLTFQCSNWAAPSLEGVNMTQAAQVIGGEKPPGMVQATHVRRVAIRNSTIRNSGAHGISLFDADRTDIEGNRFRFIAANGIDIDQGAGSNPPPRKQSEGVAIWNNHATKCGDHYSNGMFLMAGNVRGLIVEHNLIHDLPYSGMQIGQQPGSLTDVGCGENRIRYNHIHHCLQIHGDGGGIYTLGGIQNGSVIAENFIHDIKQSELDHYKVDHIYLDNYTSAIEVRDNVVRGGRAAERNQSKGNRLVNNTQAASAVEQSAGIRAGYEPRAASSD